MSQKTPKLGLTLPSGSDYYDVEIFNQNNTLIDDFAATKGQNGGLASLNEEGKLEQMPTAQDVGAHPSTWTPSADDVGAIPATEKGAKSGVATLDESGKLVQMPTAEEVGAAPYQVVSSVDFNTLTTPGLYTVRTASANKPSTGSDYSLIVGKSDSGNYVQQFAIMEDSTRAFIRYLSSNTWHEWVEISMDGHTHTAESIGAAPTYHATSVSTYGPGTNSSYGHVRLSGSASGADYAMSVSAKSTVSALNTTTYSYAGVYFIQINSSTSGTTGIEGLTTSYVYATLTTLPPPNTTGSASSGRSYEQILSIPKLQKTYHRYNFVTTTTYGTWKEILDSDFQFDLEDIGAAPKSHASSSTTYGAGTYSQRGHLRLCGNGGSSDYAMTISSKSTVSALNMTTYSYAGVYFILINSSTIGTTGIEGLTTSYVYATLTTLPPQKITGSASSGRSYEQILSIPKLQKTYHRYNYVSGSTYGTWKEIIDSDAVSYKSGDILTLSTYYVAGFITSSTEKFYFTMPLGKEIKSKNVLITGGSVVIRQNGNYIVGSASTKAEIDVDVMISATVVGDNLNCELQNMGLVKFTDATNNDVAAAQFAKLEIHFLT